MSLMVLCPTCRSLNLNALNSDVSTRDFMSRELLKTNIAFGGYNIKRDLRYQEHSLIPHQPDPEYGRRTRQKGFKTRIEKIKA